MAANSCDHHENCHRSAKLKKVDCPRLQITADLSPQLRERSVMFVNNLLATAAL